MSVVVVKANYKPNLQVKTKLTTDKKIETFSMVLMTVLFIIQLAYGDTEAIGRLAKKLITWLILSNIGYSTYRSVKSALKAAQTIQRA